MADQEHNGSRGELTAEYAALRDETLQNGRAATTTLGFVVAAGGVAMSAAANLQGQSPSELAPRLALLLFVQVFALVGTLTEILLLRATMRIASYLRTFVEPQAQMKWETRLENFRKKERPRPYAAQLRAHLVIYFVLAAGSLGLGAYYTWQAPISNAPRVLLSLLSAIIPLVLLVVVLRVDNDNKRFSAKLEELWRSVKSDEPQVR